MSAVHVVESTLRGAMNRAIRDGLAIVAGTKFAHKDGRLVGVDPLGAADEQPLTMPQGARGAIADGFDGLPFDVELDAGLGAWHALGVRLRRAYRPRRMG